MTINLVGDDELRSSLSAEPDFTATFMRHINSKEKKVLTTLLIKCSDSFARQAENTDIQFRAGVIAHEGVMITLIMVKVLDTVFDIAYNFYDEQPSNLIILVDLMNQSEIPLHFISPHDHLIAHVKDNPLAPLAKRILSMSNILAPWYKLKWQLAITMFYMAYGSVKNIWDKFDSGDGEDPANQSAMTQPIHNPFKGGGDIKPPKPCPN